MPGSTSYSPSGLSQARASDLLLVYEYLSTESTFDRKYGILPNVQVLGVSRREGGDPGSARFRYVFDGPYSTPSMPNRFEQVFPLEAAGPYTLSTDARLVVVAWHEDGSHSLLFDGFLLPVQADLAGDPSGGTEVVSFTAVGTPVREFDTPLPGAFVRDADIPLLVFDTQTDRPAHFNPEGRPNASPEDGDAGEGSCTYPTFLGPFWPENTVNGEDVRLWSLAMAAKYVIVRGTTTTDSQGNETLSKYVTYDDLTYLDTLLQSWKAGADDAGVLDDEDDSYFTVEDIEAPDTDVTGQCWPAALVRLVEPYGFGVRFVLEEGAAGEGADFGDPKWTFEVWWKEGDTPRKSLNLQEAGSSLDPGQSNVSSLSLTRDAASIANRIVVDAAPVRIEAGFVLAPIFQAVAGDLAAAASFTAEKGGLAKDNYRVWAFDETGEGHWKWDTIGLTWASDSTPGDLSPAFLMGKKKRYWALRRRKPEQCISVGEDGKPLGAQLYVSYDYGGAQPGVFAGQETAHWQQVTSDGWRLLDDRIGFRMTESDPNSWKICTPNEDTYKDFSDGKINLIERMSPTTPQPYPVFMLVCSVDSDNDFDVVAPRRASSTTGFTVTRRVDARDRFKKTVISKWSYLTDDADFGQNDVTVTDDASDAQALADGQRRHSEAAVFAGSVTIPRLSLAYALGDKIVSIDGRDVSLRSNLGAEQSESPVMPNVVGIEWNFDGQQSTTLSLSDARAEMPPRRGKRREE